MPERQWTLPSGVDPTAPKPKPPPPPPRNWKTASGGDAFWEGAKKLVPGYLGAQWQGIQNQAGNIATALSTPPGRNESPSLMATRAALGVTSGRPGMMPGMDAPAAAFHAAHQMVDDYRNAYGGVGNLKQTWAQHPERVAMDLQTLLSLGEGGAGALAERLPAGTAQRVAANTARAARVANTATNPLAVAGATVSKTAQAVRGGPAIDPQTGAWTPGAQRAAARAGISPTDMENPNFKPKLASNLTLKGNTKAAAQEAVLQYHDAPAARPTVTGVAPAGKPTDYIPTQVARANDLGHTAINGKVDQLVNAAPDATWRSGRQTAVQTPGPDGTPTFDPAKTRQMLADPAHPDRPLFTDQELSDLSLAANGKAILDAPPDLGARMAPSWTGRLARAGIGAGVIGGLGAAAHAAGATDLMHMIPGIPQMGELAAGAIGEQFIDPYFAKLAEQRTISGGAPVRGGWAAPIEGAGTGLNVGARAAPILSTTGALLPPPPQPEQKAGPAAPSTAGPDLSTTPGVDAGPAPTPQANAPVDLSQVPGVDETPAAAPAPAPEPERKPERQRAEESPPPPPSDSGTDLSQVQIPQAAGGRVERADGGHVTGMVDRLMARAEREGKATRSATKPLLGLDDTTVAKALAIAGRAI